MARKIFLGKLALLILLSFIGCNQQNFSPLAAQSPSETKLIPVDEKSLERLKALSIDEDKDEAAYQDLSKKNQKEAKTIIRKVLVSNLSHFTRANLFEENEEKKAICNKYLAKVKLSELEKYISSIGNRYLVFNDKKTILVNYDNLLQGINDHQSIMDIFINNNLNDLDEEDQELKMTILLLRYFKFDAKLIKEFEDGKALKEIQFSKTKSLQEALAKKMRPFAKFTKLLEQYNDIMQKTLLFEVIMLDKEAYKSIEKSSKSNLNESFKEAFEEYAKTKKLKTILQSMDEITIKQDELFYKEKEVCDSYYLVKKIIKFVAKSNEDLMPLNLYDKITAIAQEIREKNTFKEMSMDTQALLRAFLSIQ